ncbi:MAG: BamA/TamA family outer membrane protein [Reinekea sp.]
MNTKIMFATMVATAAICSPAFAEDLKPAAWVPLPAIGSSPETGFLYGAYIMRIFPQTDVDVPQNRLETLLQGTAKGQYQAYIWPNIYFDQGNWQAKGTLGGKYWPASYYGQGNESPEDGDKFADTSFKVSSELNRQVTADIKLGGAIFAEYHSIKDIDEDPTTLLLTSDINGYDGGLFSGLGLRAQYDTRNNIDWPTTGALITAKFDAFTSVLGSDIDFTTGKLRMTQYTSINQDVLAFSSQIASASKETPFTHLPKADGSRSLRGADGNHWIDYRAVGFQTEYRKPLGSKWAAVLFFDTFQVASKFSDMEVGDFHYSPGFGVRYAMTPDRFNLRLDIASVDLDGVTLAAITVSEAF